MVPNMQPEISSSLLMHSPSLSTLTWWIFKHYMQSFSKRNLPTWSHLFIDFEVIFCRRDNFKPTVKTSRILIPLLLIFSAAIATRGKHGHLLLHLSAEVWERRIVSPSVLKRNRHIPSGDGFSLWILHERRCPHHYNFLWSRSFLSATLFEKIPEVLMSFLIHCLGNLMTRTLRVYLEWKWMTRKPVPVTLSIKFHNGSGPK